MTMRLTKFEKARRMLATGKSTREVATALGMHIQSVRDAKRHGSKPGRPPVPAHKKRAAKRQLGLRGVSTKRKTVKR